MPTDPEKYYFTSTHHVPNSRLPALIYRSAIPRQSNGEPPTAEWTRECIEKNEWMQGGVFKTFKAHHFHSVTHECYAVFRGSSRLLLGRGPLDDAASHDGQEVDVTVGDVVVLPAGVAHCSLSSEDDYEYVGLYPKVRCATQGHLNHVTDILQGSPRYDNNFCKAGPDETKRKAEVCEQVAIPNHDPVFGAGGPLVSIWNASSTS
ncbi:MAG: hypothetical protein M1833_003715 [Piccolia ochrophora]|nr:MAG: hypothetical protein M1833_003715 [Piccolia ochrophora]